MFLLYFLYGLRSRDSFRWGMTLLVFLIKAHKYASILSKMQKNDSKL